MVLEKIDGIPCTDINQIEEHGINKKDLAENGVMIFLNQVFRDNFFHGRPWLAHGQPCPWSL